MTVAAEFVAEPRWSSQAAKPFPAIVFAFLVEVAVAETPAAARTAFSF